MKVAFVSQPIDSVLPPYQNSVGACTYGAACALAKSSEVVVYGLQNESDDPPHLVKHDVRFHLVPSSPRDRLMHRLRTKLSRVMRMQPFSTSNYFYPHYGLQVARALSKQPFDVIHIQHLSQYIPIIRKLNPRAKIVLHLHAEWFSQSKTAELLPRLQGLDMLTTVSDYVTGQVTRSFPDFNKPCVTHYNGYDPSEFLREKDYSLTAGRGELRIFFAGGVSPHKGIHVLIDAFKLVAARLPNIRLNLCGPHGTYPIEENFDMRDQAVFRELAPFYLRDISRFRKLLGSGREAVPDYVEMLRAKLSPELNAKVSFLGKIPRPELIERYYDADLFVFPSLFAEGFGLPPLEAMAAGVPVVGTRSGAIVETVQDGVTGLLVEKNDANALAGAILKLLGSTSLREKMGRAGRRRALEHFTWDVVTRKMAMNYRALCSSKTTNLD